MGSSLHCNQTKRTCEQKLILPKCFCQVLQMQRKTELLGRERILHPNKILLRSLFPCNLTNRFQLFPRLYSLRCVYTSWPVLYKVPYSSCLWVNSCNGVQREHNKKLNNGLPILHKVPPKRDYGRYFCIMAEKGGTSHGGLTEKLSPFFHAKKQEVNAYGR